MLELAYSCGLRCEEIVNLDLGASTSRPSSCGSSARARRSALLPVGEPAQRALRALPGARRGRALAADPRERALFLSKSGRRLSNSDVTRRLGALGARGGARRRRLAALAAPLASPPTCSRAGPTCARSRSCSATPRSRPPRSTLGSTPPACATRTRASPSAAHECDASRKWPSPATIESLAEAMETGVKEVELRDLWRRYKDGRRRRRARAAGRRLLADGQVRRRPPRRRAALARRRRRPDLLRPDGPDRGDRALRARARDQVRDLRDDPDPRRDHRRAALARLGAALGRARAPARSRPPRRSSSTSCSGRRARRSWPTKLGITEDELQSLAAGDRQLLGLRARRALDGLRLLRRPGLAARHDLRPARRRPAGGARQQRGQGPPHRGDRLAARARAARRRPLLLREPHPARDRRGPRRHRVARLPAAHQGRDAAEEPPAAAD